MNEGGKGRKREEEQTKVPRKQKQTNKKACEGKQRLREKVLKRDDREKDEKDEIKGSVGRKEGRVGFAGQQEGD